MVYDVDEKVLVITLPDVGVATVLYDVAPETPVNEIDTDDDVHPVI